MGSNTLADWLLNPAKPEKIIERQNVVKEISATADWRQQSQAFGAA